MNYTQSFDEFASSLGPTDVALYAGLAIILWVLFKDKLNPLTSFVQGVVNNLKTKQDVKVVTVPVPEMKPVATSTLNTTQTTTRVVNNEDVFFQLVTSWKKTRDLAVIAGCVEAVKSADAMFPYLSPNICGKTKKEEL